MGGRKCRECEQQTGANRRLCQMCSLNKRYGTGFDRGSDIDDEPDELGYQCVACGHEQVATLTDDCEECGERRWRYIGPHPGEGGEAVATDGGGSMPGTRDHASDTDDEEFVDALQELALDLRRTADAIQTATTDYRAGRLDRDETRQKIAEHLDAGVDSREVLQAGGDGG